MAFFKSLFGNPSGIEDESYALDSLEKGTVNLSSKNMYIQPEI